MQTILFATVIAAFVMIAPAMWATASLPCRSRRLPQAREPHPIEDERAGVERASRTKLLAPSSQGISMPVAYDFSDRVAIVTGGARGIGRSIAERLRDARAKVFVWDLLKPDYEGVTYGEADVSDGSAVARALSRLAETSETVDILVNNAGFLGPATSVLDFDPADWRRSVEVNLVSFYVVCRQVLPLMKQSACGRMVNMASIAGKEGSPFLSAYSAAKAGVIAFTKSLGKELAETNIRVNAIAPGPIDTEILLQLSPEDVRGLIQKSPMKRLGTADEVAALTMWLCSEDCSFCTGATFDMSGGRAVF